MKKIFITLFALTVIIIAAAFAWQYFYPSGIWRYKITVYVETPEGVKSGNAVREVTVRRTPRVTPQAVSSVKLRGEAVVVDLGDRGTLYAVMGSDDYRMIFKTFPISGSTAKFPPMSKEGIHYYSTLKGVKASLDLKYYPVIVSFKKINDPTTVKPVYIIKSQDEVIVEDHLAEFFGEGVRLKNIEIEMTTDKVTKNIDRYLPWLSSLEGNYLDGKSSGGGPAISNILHEGNFKRER